MLLRSSAASKSPCAASGFVSPPVAVPASAPDPVLDPSLRSREATMAAADFWWLFPSPHDDSSPEANHQTSPGITHSPSRLSLSDLRRDLRASTGLCIHWPAHPIASPLSAGCSSEQRFACSFLRIPPRHGHPCCSANTSPCRVCRGLTPPSECALPGARIKKADPAMDRPLG